MKARAAATPDRRRPILYATMGVIALALVIAVGYLSRNPSVVPSAASETHTQTALKVGSTAPDFSVSTTAGPFTLASAQTPVFLEVFATWCPHCQREVTVINDLYRTYGKQVQFVGVDGSQYGMDENSAETQADVVAFAARLGVEYPIAYDPDLTVAKQYLSSGFPTLVVIGRDKKILTMLDGEQPKAALDKAIRAAL
jgi:thiol-disulfide isomerase/thioredoxin